MPRGSVTNGVDVVYRIKIYDGTASDCGVSFGGGRKVHVASWLI